MALNIAHPHRKRGRLAAMRASLNMAVMSLIWTNFDRSSGHDSIWAMPTTGLERRGVLAQNEPYAPRHKGHSGAARRRGRKLSGANPFEGWPFERCWNKSSKNMKRGDIAAILNFIRGVWCVNISKESRWKLFARIKMRGIYLVLGQIGIYRDRIFELVAGWFVGSVFFFGYRNWSWNLKNWLDLKKKMYILLYYFVHAIFLILMIHKNNILKF